MQFNTRNAYYLRVSSNTILPLYLYLDEQHTSWMSERVLQHVLADLRPLIIPKLIAEDAAQLGPGGSSSAKKGTLDVHRGDTYQFGYFLRNAEPHAVLIKTRRFTAAPPKPKHAPKLQEAEAGVENAPKKRGRGSRKGKEPAKKKQNTGKARAKGKSTGKGKQKAMQFESDEEEAIDIPTDEDEDDTVDREPAAAPEVAPRRSTRKRNVTTGGYQEDASDGGDGDVPHDPKEKADEDVEMAEQVPYEVTNDVGMDDTGLIAMDQSEDTTPAPVKVKSEQPEPTIPEAIPRPDSPIAVDSDPPAPLLPTNRQAKPDTILVDSDEEEKPKPIMKLKYQGFSIGGRCLCVIVEPYPPLPKAARALSLAPTGLAGPRAPSIAPADFILSGQQRGKTPLFLPEDDDRETTPAPWQGRMRASVSRAQEAQDEADDEDDGGMFAYSQILQSVGEYATGAAEDDDDIEGAVFFGDADENREL